MYTRDLSKEYVKVFTFKETLELITRSALMIKVNND